MDILITGGTGLIGRRLCAALLGAGHRLTVLSRQPATVQARCGQGVAAIGSLDAWTPDIAYDAVINLAGEPIIDAPWTEARQKRLWDSRVTLTETLAQRIAQAARKPQAFLSGSATGYYGDAGQAALDESAPPATDFGARLCVAWENAALAAAQADVRVCLLRTGLVLDPAGGLLGKMRPSFALGLGARIGDGAQWMSWIHMDDYVALALRLLESPQAAGPYNMTAPQPATNRAFTAELAKALGRPARFAAPAWLMRLALGQRAYLLLGGQRALPAQAEALGYRFRHPELGEALRSLLA
jgi:uncharacterized protein (TIGR01777 family)